MCCSDSKFVAIAAPRGHAKSTALTLAYTLASILFRQSKFIVIISDTESQASMFLNNIKKELTDNEDIKLLFGVSSLSKDSETDCIIEFEDGYQARMVAKGSEQKLRGLNWSSGAGSGNRKLLRPDLIIGDDMENDEIVMNDQRREKFRRWFTGAVVPALDKSGKLRLIGTILHLDSLLANYMPQRWHKDVIQDELRVKSAPNAVWLAANYRAHPGMQDFSHVLWPAFKPAPWLKAEQQSYIKQGLSDVYSQEYLNEPIDDTNALFKKSDFKALTPADLDKHVHFYCAMDLATTKDNVKRDYSVFTVGGVTEDNQLQIRYVFRDRIDTLEICERILQIQRIFQPLGFIIEKGMLTNSILPFMKVKMAEENVWPIFHPVAKQMDKIQHTFSIRARMRSGMVKFDKEAEWYPPLEQECIQFPRMGKDDQVDTLSLLGTALDKLITAPTKEEIMQDEYRQELEESQTGFVQDGRSEVTGY